VETGNVWSRQLSLANYVHSYLRVAVVVGFGTRSEIANHAEFTDGNFSNIIMRPMIGTVRALPWAGGDGKRRVGEVLCEASWIAPYLDGAPVTACTRYMARTQLERLSTLGYQLMSGYEAKFFVYRNGGGDRELTDRPLFHGGDFASSLIIEEHAELVYSMAELLSAAGVDVAAVHIEGSSGQLEFATGTKFGIESADQMFTLKEAVKEIALGRGCQATFMTMPRDGPDFNSGMHFNGSLWTGDKNAFHDPADSWRLSAVGRHWTAGLVKHAAALKALLSPTVNCYRRHQGLIPDRANCGLENRNASFRIVASSPRTTYVENRLPSSAANPYVVLAATVAAGVDGLLNRLEPSSESKDHGDKLPSSLPEALSALEADKVLCDALGRQFIRWFSTVKSDVEIAKVNRAKDEGLDDLQVERELYFKFL